ncbi:MAG: hypothetical protein RLN74_01360, partial [Ilumatobacter fluminis]
GSQWDQNVVTQVMATLPAMAPAGAFVSVGRPHEQSGPAAHSIDVSQVPDDLSEILAAVDAEI